MSRQRQDDPDLAVQQPALPGLGGLAPERPGQHVDISIFLDKKYINPAPWSSVLQFSVLLFFWFSIVSGFLKFFHSSVLPFFLWSGFHRGHGAAAGINIILKHINLDF